jgi:cystathionine beta-lyase/cystathionine gamma-synthase
VTRRGFSTRAIHSAKAPVPTQQPSSVPIFQSSVWRFETSGEFADVLAMARPGHAYGRGYGNPTVEAFEAVSADLEETEAAYGFASGTAAIFTTCVALAGGLGGLGGSGSPGAGGGRIVTSRHLYGGTHSLFHEVLPGLGVEVDFVDARDLEAVAATLDEGAAAFYVETIANPLCAVADLEALAGLCRERGIRSVVDNTFASAWLCAPAGFGFDFVVNSVTKFMAGHSDVIGGVVCSSAEDRLALRKLAIEIGGAMQPFDAWLSTRGLETLEVRVKRQCETAQRIAEALASEDRVLAVNYPGLADHPDHATARRIFRQPAFGGVLSVEVAGGVEGAARWCDAMQLAWIGASLGGTHTLVSHPASTTHRQVDPAQRRALGLADGLVRVSCGLEDPEDLIEDLVGSLKAI